MEKQENKFGEEDVGIEEFLLSSQEHIVINCTIKHRYTDFIVNEIDEQGNVIWFQSEQNNLEKWKMSNIKETLPQSVTSMLQNQEEEDKINQSDLYVPSKENFENLKEVLDQIDADDFYQFTIDLQEEKIEKSSIMLFKGNYNDKEKRTKVHQFFKKFLKKYESDTLSEGQERKIRVFLKEGMGKNKRQKIGISTQCWGQKKQLNGVQMPEYLEIAMQKTNFETMQAIHYISKRVKKMPKYFGICGNKDKRGITTQRITISRGNAEQIIKAQMSKDWDQKLKLGSFKRVFQPVNLGQLWGNRFSVALRFIDKSISNESIAKNVKNIEELGFINYFGMQRFGSYSVRTHQIGKEILNHNWQEVVRLFLIQHADYDQNQKKRKQIIADLIFSKENQDQCIEERIDRAINLLDRKDRIEKTILQQMKKHPFDYCNAFASISRNTRFIYIHAYQSYVWNKAVSERLRKFNRQVLIGDLVLSKDQQDIDEEPIDDNIENIQDDFDEQNIENEQIIEEENLLNQEEGQEKQTVRVGKKEIKVIEINEKNINEYSIDDVILPIVGYKVQFPKNKDIKKIYEDIMEKDHMSIEKFQSHADVVFTSAAGSYRKMIGRASDISFDIVETQNNNNDLLTANYQNEADPIPVINENGGDIKKALRIKFNLKASSYATMFLREVTRTSSAYSSQLLLTDKMNQDI